MIDVSADAILIPLFEELRAFPAPGDAGNGGAPPVRTDLDRYAGVAVPFRYRTAAGVLSFFSATTVFGTPVDVTLAELAIEAFFPADAATAEALRAPGAAVG
jgi:hypothetical protein